MIGILLAGGASRRYGSPKAFAQLDGQFFYTYSLKALSPLTYKQVIISQSTFISRFQKDGHTNIIQDHEAYVGKGPLAGIYTAMEKEKSADTWFLVAPCDTPYLKSEVYEILLEYISEDYDVIIPVVAERQQPLIGLYHSRISGTLKRLLDDDILKVGALLQRTRVKYVKDERLQTFSTSFTNINYVSDRIDS
ncbi:molybdenum cofactor guanylyltransferase [Alkalihalobacillus pseudalcaliphilus]|uniref:molybdenum cofactor guanylyltransferase n=1 Tax=Alkalihalobacillus pseudalcaliphilus TaxID=79884 RepID=UPI00064D9A3C|nr:molybdenum cofactor guanylyltransferase [Alkalihalobacillus pseudalcaliphilus]KMK74705.1 hypothetical protein AB990_19655 [Alkalihalobacillus pseudalcaliphilus]